MYRPVYVHVLSINIYSRKEQKDGYLRLLYCRLLAETERLVATIEGNELSLEHGVTVNLETGALVALNAAEAGRVCLVDSGKSDLVTRNLGHVGVTDSNRHIGKGSGARVDVTTNLSIELGALDLGVVGIGDLLVDEKE